MIKHVAKVRLLHDVGKHILLFFRRSPSARLSCLNSRNIEALMFEVFGSYRRCLSLFPVARKPTHLLKCLIMAHEGRCVTSVW